MADFIDITLVANAGVLVEYDGRGLLVDGIHQEEGHPFTRVPETTLARMQQRHPPFADLHYLLFTHEHPDHFTPELVRRQVDCAPPDGLFLPGEQDASPALTGLLAHLRSAGISHRRLGLAPGQTRRFMLGDELSVTAIGTRHMGPQYQHVSNDCFLLHLGDLRVLLTGDADHVPAYYQDATWDGPLDAVFVNPIFFHHPDGQAIINDILEPRHVVIYHMPDAATDTMHFDYMVRRDMEKYALPNRQVHVLRQEGQHLRLHASPVGHTTA